MKMHFSVSRFAVMAVIAVGLANAPAQASIILEQYEFQGVNGGIAPLAPSLVNSALSGLSTTASAGLVGVTATNSINASGWNNPGASFSLGFNVNAGYSATVSQIVLTSKSSGTGPGFITVEASVDGGALVAVANITQAGTNYNDEMLSITPVTALHSVVFYFVATNQTSAAGGTIGSAGTFRIGDYNPSGTPTPFTLNGTVTPLSLVPEPASIAMALVGLLVAPMALRGRRRAA